MSEKKRLFLAVNLNVATTRRIADTIGKMRAAAERRGLSVGWVPAANLHVTLKFLGWSSAEVVEAVRDKVRAVILERQPFELQARGTGGFPNDAAARVLWIGVADPTGALGAIAGQLNAALATIGFPAETRPFHPHVTIGRSKEGQGTDELLAPWQKSELGSSVVREIVLYESILKSNGSEYIAQFREPIGIPERQTREVETSKESEEPHGGQQQPG